MIHYLKDFTYKGTKYKFKEPLRVTINNFLCMDGKTLAGEMSIPSVLAGYTRKEPFENPEKEIKAYIKTVFEEFLFTDDSKLDEYERKYKHDWIALFKPPEEKRERIKKEKPVEVKKEEVNKKAKTTKKK